MGEPEQVCYSSELPNDFGRGKNKNWSDRSIDARLLQHRHSSTDDNQLISPIMEAPVGAT